MLFKINDKPLFDENPGLMAIPEFVDKPERLLRYIFLVYDFESPYRKIPFEMRKEKCAVIAGYKYEKDGKRLDKNGREVISGSNPLVSGLVKVFMELQGDPDKELLVAYRDMLQDMKELMRKKNKTEKETGLVLKISKDLPDLIRKQKELEDLIESREGALAAPEEPSRPMSTLDEINSEQ